MLARGALVPGSFPHLANTLGCQNIAMTFAFEPAPNNNLGAANSAKIAAQRIHVRGIKKIHPASRGFVENFKRFVFFGLQAERHGAKAEPRDGESRRAEIGILHVTPQTCVWAAA